MSPVAAQTRSGNLRFESYMMSPKITCEIPEYASLCQRLQIAILVGGPRAATFADRQA